MICGNNPHTPLTPDDRAMVAWFRDWLAWSKLPAAERAAAQEPPVPDGGAQPVLPVTGRADRDQVR